MLIGTNMSLTTNKGKYQLANMQRLCCVNPGADLKVPGTEVCGMGTHDVFLMASAKKHRIPVSCAHEPPAPHT